MRTVVQRVARAAVSVAGERIAAIGPGLLILLGVGPEDGPEDIAWLAGKIARLRIFVDDAGKMNHSVVDVGGGLIVVSQFTLYADLSRGNRPAFTASAPPQVAEPLYRAFVDRLAAETGLAVGTGRFGADMAVELVNDGPVTIALDSESRA